MSSNSINTQYKVNKTRSFEDILAKEGYFVYTAIGNSMLPFLREKKDIIEIKPITSHPQKYSVYLYKRKGHYILHRCISTDPYVFAGDHNTFKEYDVNESMILGEMTRVIRNGKSIYSTSLLYRIYAHLWVDFFPIKVFILKIKAKIRGFARKLLKRTGYSNKR